MGSPIPSSMVEFFRGQGITDPAEIQARIAIQKQHQDLLTQNAARNDPNESFVSALERETRSPLDVAIQAVSTPALPKLASIPAGASPQPQKKGPEIPTPKFEVTPPDRKPAAQDSPAQQAPRMLVRNPNGTWEYTERGDRTPEEISRLYEAGVAEERKLQTGIKGAERVLAAQGAEKIDKPLNISGVGGPSVGEASMAAIDAGQRGGFSYAGTPGFDLAKKYTADEYAGLHPAERAEIDKIEQAQAARSMREIEINKARALSEAEADPVGFRQRQVQQYLSSARQELMNPESFLYARYQMGMREFIAQKKPTPEQINDFAMFLQNKLVTEQAEANAMQYGQWIAGQDPRVLSSAARNPLAGLFGMGGAGGTP